MQSGTFTQGVVRKLVSKLRPSRFKLLRACPLSIQKIVHPGHRFDKLMPKRWMPKSFDKDWAAKEDAMRLAKFLNTQSDVLVAESASARAMGKLVANLADEMQISAKAGTYKPHSKGEVDLGAECSCQRGWTVKECVRAARI